MFRMNNRILSVALVCAFCVAAHAQEPPGCVANTHTKKQLKQHRTISGKLPKRKVLDLRKHHKVTPDKKIDNNVMPVFASPIYLPQEGMHGTAITASDGYLFVVVGEKLYKVNQKTLKTVQVSRLGQATLEVAKDAPKHKKKKAVASSDGVPKSHRPARSRSKTD
jgi:hypothetical protein